MGKLFGKVAIITGSSRGIGKGIALALAKEGVAIVLNGRNQDRLDETQKLLFEETANVVSFCGDVSDEKAAKEMIEFAISSFGRIDILVNNVGVSNRGTIEESAPSVFRRVFESNVYGSVFPTIYALPQIKQNKGSIVFISSVAGIRGLPGLGAYSSSKMALKSIAETLRIEEHVSGIHIGLIYVGITDIEHNKESIGPDGKPVVLENRTNKKTQSIEFVANKVLQNIKSRKFITTLSRVGKLNQILQPIVPNLVEKIIIKASKKFDEGRK
jgi:NAD(P)-dependent dehydrogenase (short-subunit alcohol dehydrogenase family)